MHGIVRTGNLERYCPCTVYPLPGSPSGNLPRVYCLPTASGSTNAYDKLARISKVPLFGIRVIKRDAAGDLVPFQNLTEFALCIAKALDGYQANGPISLLGYSFGGPLAVEVANQLQKRGRVVPIVYVIDTPPAWINLDRKRRIWHFSKYILPWSVRAAVRIATGKNIWATRYGSAMTARLRGKRKFEGETWYADLPEDRRQYVKQHAIAFRQHRFMECAAVKLVLFRAAGRNLDPFSPRPLPDFGWQGITGANVEVIAYQGDHASIISQPQIFADKICQHQVPALLRHSLIRTVSGSGGPRPQQPHNSTRRTGTSS
jgi:thioesterase domain-containing protein